ncbi:MAG: HAD-IA family hydrolase, partial [bacterium]|nr:HAD-IA family hydrolase [bacterium]
MLKTINSLEQLLTGENMDRGKIKMVLFDIDGTLAESKLIKDILFRTLEEFNISERVIPKLGKEIVNEKWLTNKLGLS